MEQKETEVYIYLTKKQNSKTQSIISINQPKFNKNEVFYKAKISKNILKINEFVQYP